MSVSLPVVVNMRDYNEAVKHLFSLRRFGIRPGLDNISAVLDSLGNPEGSFVTVHIAGSKGKGSVCTFIASILQTAGYKTGLYTSPHLISFTERICINGKPIPEREVVRLI